MNWCMLLLMICLLWKEAVTVDTRKLFDRTQLPKLLDIDMIELYHLKSFPLLLIDTAAGTFSTQTTGMALRSTTTGETIVLQYKPVNYSNCFLPIIGSGEGNNATLIWDKRAEVVYYNTIDTDFWQQSTFLARINGVVYKNYIRWIEEYVETNRQFSPQSICSSVNDLSCFTFAETWETFLADSVKLNAILPPRAVELRFLSFHEPVEFQLSPTATSSPTEYPTSTPSMSPSASPSAAFTAVPTGRSANNASSSPADEAEAHEVSPDLFHDGNAGSPEEPDEEHGLGRHFSDDASRNSFFSDSDSESADVGDRKRRGRRKLEEVPMRHLRYSRRGSGAAVAPLESVEDSELDRPPRGGGYFPPSDDPLGQPPGGGAGGSGGGGNAGGDGMEMVSVGTVADYYSNIMSCMEEYQLGDFTSALKSCMSETVGFVHIDGDRYYRIKHRYPFIYVYDYLEFIPDPQYNAVHGADYADLGIIFFISMFALLGFVASMAKLQVAEFLCADGYWCNFSSSSHHHQDISRSLSDDDEHGYTQQQSRVSKVMTKVWGTMGWRVRNFSSSYSRVHTSDEDLAAMGLRERVEIHSFDKETVFAPSVDDEDGVGGRVRNNSNSSASSSGFIGVPRMGSMSIDLSSPRAAQTVTRSGEVEMTTVGQSLETITE